MHREFPFPFKVVLEKTYLSDAEKKLNPRVRLEFALRQAILDASNSDIPPCNHLLSDITTAALGIQGGRTSRDPLVSNPPRLRYLRLITNEAIRRCVDGFIEVARERTEPNNELGPAELVGWLLAQLNAIKPRNPLRDKPSERQEHLNVVIRDFNSTAALHHDLLMRTARRTLEEAQRQELQALLTSGWNSVDWPAIQLGQQPEVREPESEWTGGLIRILELIQAKLAERTIPTPAVRHEDVMIKPIMAASYLGVSRDRVYKMGKRGELRVDPATRRVSESDVMKAKRQLRKEGPNVKAYEEIQEQKDRSPCSS